MAITVNLNSLSTYADTSNISTGPARIRDLALALRERMVNGGHYLPDNADANSGLHMAPLNIYDQTVLAAPDLADPIIEVADAAVDINRPLNVSGAASLAASLDVTGNATIDGDLTIGGALVVAGVVARKFTWSGSLALFPVVSAIGPFIGGSNLNVVWTVGGTYKMRFVVPDVFTTPITIERVLFSTVNFPLTLNVNGTTTSIGTGNNINASFTPVAPNNTVASTQYIELTYTGTIPTGGSSAANADTQVALSPIPPANAFVTVVMSW